MILYYQLCCSLSMVKQFYPFYLPSIFLGFCFPFFPFYFIFPQHNLFPKGYQQGTCWNNVNVDYQGITWEKICNSRLFLLFYFLITKEMHAYYRKSGNTSKHTNIKNTNNTINEPTIILILENVFEVFFLCILCFCK